MRNLLGQLRPEDRFNIVLFAGRAAVLSDRSLPATQENIDQAWAFIDGQDGGGVTELLTGLHQAFGLPLAGEGYARIVAVVTDGAVGFEAAAFKLVRQRLDQASLFAFGIGSSVNRFLIGASPEPAKASLLWSLKKGRPPTRPPVSKRISAPPSSPRWRRASTALTPMRWSRPSSPIC